ncbi:MAG: aminotransferase class I/II-fold pyridoxal phosphate-dependent enzyme [Lachnospiraceae bacterium]|nr:aminotransferase class I/II-fold pyridoxal phosphate-dependent enzyme [Lachnospiraceae bacterium]
MGELYRRLKEYTEADYYPFHMPGHKRQQEAAEGSLGKLYRLDITEIDGFDNLHQAAGILESCQQRAARLYGADRTWMLVNGSTCGILAAIMAATKKGGRLLMARNCHRSVYHGVYLQELETAYLYPPMIQESGIAGGILPCQVEKALQEERDIGAVMITSPTYEGVVSDIEKIADITHRYNIPLIVDEAHGAHFGFHPDYPANSLSQGADVVIHSLHKTLPSMTQTSLLHLKGSLVSVYRLERYLQIFQTSSPSYVLMASMEACLDQLEEQGRRRLGRLLELRQELTNRLEDCRYIKLPEIFRQEQNQEEQLRQKGIFHRDPCKLVIATQSSGLTGAELYQVLRQKHHLQMEMAAEGYVLAILTMMDTREGMQRLAEALWEIDKEEGEKKSVSIQKNLEVEAVKPGKAVMAISRAYDGESEQLPVSTCEGRIAAEFISVYPPGIPLAVPGERLDRELIHSILSVGRMGLNLQGIGKNGCIRVVKEYLVRSAQQVCRPAE